ncbi:MAG: aromatic ring-hydroxylating oxygenase subunit alpha [Micavibrio sp.]
MTAGDKTLPHYFYYDPEILSLETKTIFDKPDAQLFWGHKALVPEKGDYWVIPHSGSPRILVNDGNNLNVVDNICRHRYAVMLEGKGNIKKIICPVHYWSYELDGSLIKAPGFDPLPAWDLDCDGRCGDAQRSLGRKDIVDYDSFILSKDFTLLSEALDVIKKYTSLKFNELDFVDLEICPNKVNWKDYVDTYLDNYHIDVYHPGLKGLVNCNKIDFHWDEQFHVQAVQIKNTMIDAANGKYQPLLKMYKEKIGEFEETYGAIWAMVYPNIMIEIYEKFFFLNVVLPDDAENCTVWKYSFCHKSLSQHPEIVRMYTEFLDEIEQQDIELMMKVNDGRKALYARGDHYRGPYHPQKEQGQAHFHRWLLNRLGIDLDEQEEKHQVVALRRVEKS